MRCNIHGSFSGPIIHPEADNDSSDSEEERKRDVKEGRQPEPSASTKQGNPHRMMCQAEYFFSFFQDIKNNEIKIEKGNKKQVLPRQN
jgi:hypothetical protein